MSKHLKIDRFNTPDIAENVRIKKVVAKLEVQCFEDAKRTFSDQSNLMAITLESSKGNLLGYEGIKATSNTIKGYILRNLTATDIIIKPNPKDPKLKDVKKFGIGYSLINAERRATWLSRFIANESEARLTKNEGYLKDLFERVEDFIIKLTKEDAKEMKTTRVL